MPGMQGHQVTEKVLRPEGRPYIEQERVNVCYRPARMALLPR
ncbi:MAG: hypothetical protein RBS57_01020 [Desulforhabdus sp.]|uniref:Uncharacterized protein n=1 Tax=Desulfococcus multivorans DSM 2059 TaxID=1121405 RepID=S7TY69_DESML|nr:hypothetical protein dsmv_1813 [Desulfococcus multivorans DSM 2059]MDY0038865.1 hypothetical protein [Desulforhabdus sp.]SKA09030.1 hypothetical protein SAMN02745446_02700 [Desulfococcus multivorans DSM 2059]